MTARPIVYAAPLWFRKPEKWQLMWGVLLQGVLHLYDSKASAAKGLPASVSVQMSQQEMQFVRTNDVLQDGQARRYMKCIELRPKDLGSAVKTSSHPQQFYPTPAVFAAETAAAHAAWSNRMENCLQVRSGELDATRWSELDIAPDPAVLALLSCCQNSVLQAIQKTRCHLRPGEVIFQLKKSYLTTALMHLKDLHAAILCTDVDLQDGKFNVHLHGDVHECKLSIEHPWTDVHQSAACWLNKLDVYVTKLISEVQAYAALDASGAHVALQLLEIAFHKLNSADVLDGHQDVSSVQSTPLSNQDSARLDSLSGSIIHAKQLVPFSRQKYLQYWAGTTCL